MIEMARRIDAATRMEPGAERDEALRDLIRRNWRMWTILQAALLDPESTVPNEIRENLLNLSNFIDKRSVECLSDADPKKLAVLININRQIGAGLMGNPSDDPAEAERLRAEASARLGTAQNATDAGPGPNDDQSGHQPASGTPSSNVATDTEA